MELTWCRSFIAVCEFGGFSAAAKALHRSQSRISAHVAALESELGERLLHRDVHPPTLTSAGEAFFPHARGVTDEWVAAVAAVNSRRGQTTGVVAVGSVPSTSSQLLAPIIARFGQQHPGVTFEVHEGPNSWLDEALARRLVEITLRSLRADKAPPATERLALLQDPFMVVLRRDHLLASRTSLTVDDLAGCPVITTGEAGLDAKVGSEFREVLDGSGVNVRNSLAVTQPSTVFAFVEAGLGLGVVGRLPAQMLNDPRLVSVPLDDPRATRQIGAEWASTRRLSPAADAFLRALVSFTRSSFPSSLPPRTATAAKNAP